jgi:hypothetical protein
MATLFSACAMLVVILVRAGAPAFPLVIGIFTAAFSAGLSGWGICTAIGIFRRRGWARISILIFAVLLTLMSVSAGLMILFMTALPTQEGVNQGLTDTMRWGVAGFYGVLGAIGVWWLVLFNLRSTKEYFVPGAPREPSARPLSISVIGWYLLISSLFLVVGAVFRMPALVFGLVITGWGGLAVFTVFAAVQIFLGTGLLHLQERARVGSIGYFCLIALNSVLSITPPGLAAKMQILQREMPKAFGTGTAAQMPEPGWVVALMGVGIAAVPIWFLLRRRATFERAAAE